MEVCILLKYKNKDPYMTVSFVNEPIQLFSARHFLLKFLNFHYLILWLIRRCGMIIIILLLAQSRIVMNTISFHLPYWVSCLSATLIGRHLKHNFYRLRKRIGELQSLQKTNPHFPVQLSTILYNQQSKYLPPMSHLPAHL